MKNSTFVNRFLVYAATQHEPMTVYTYQRTMAALVSWADEQGVDLQTASPGDLLRFADLPLERGKRAGESRSPAYKKRRLMELRSLYKWASKVERLVVSDPAEAFKPPKHQRVINPKPIPVDTWTRVWNSNLADSDRVAFGLGMFAGLRRDEVCRLAPSSVVTELILTNFWRKGGKIIEALSFASAYAVFCDGMPSLVGDPSWFPSALRRVLMARRGEPLLLDWREDQRASQIRRRHSVEGMDMAFIDPHTFNARFEKAQRAAGIAADDRCTPHQLRHGFVTYLVDILGADDLVAISRAAGHASVEITLAYLKVGTPSDPLAAVTVRQKDVDDPLGGAVLKFPSNARHAR